MKKFANDRYFYQLGMCLYFIGFLACAYFQFRVMANISSYILHPSFIKWALSYLVIHLICTLFTMRHFDYKSYKLAMIVAIIYLLSSYYYFYIFLGFLIERSSIDNFRMSVYLGQAATLIYGVTLLFTTPKKDLFLKIIGITFILDTSFALISFFKHEIVNNIQLESVITLLYRAIATLVVFTYILFMLTFWKEHRKITNKTYSLKFTDTSAILATTLAIISISALLYFTPKLESERNTMFKILGDPKEQQNKLTEIQVKPSSEIKILF